MQDIVGRPLYEQKVKAYFKLMQENEGFWNSFIVFLSALFLLSAIPFYPIIAVFFIALVLGAIAYKNPVFATSLVFLSAIPAFAYQSPVFGWISLLAFAVILFEVFQFWFLISLVEIIIFAPFAPFPLSLLSGFVFFGLLFGAFRFGSQKSIYFSIPAIFLILLLSSIWLVPNAAFFPVNLAIYQPQNMDIGISKPVAQFSNFGASFSSSLASFFDLQKFNTFPNALGKIWDNSLKILFRDSGFIQLLLWAGILFLVAYLPPRVKGEFRQTISSLPLLFVPIVYLFIFPQPYPIQLPIYTTITILLMFVFEKFGFRFSREREIMTKEKMKKFSKFGIEDLSLSAGGKLKDFGGYDDVKKELVDSIVLPLQEKDLAEAYGLKPPSGILLFGPPGTGKTMLMRALAKELSYSFYYIKTSDILSHWFGESEKNVSEIFQKARETAPAILFFDEIDAIGKKRDSYSTDDVSPRILSVFLQEIDGFKRKGKPVIVVGATNVPHQLDPALMRPGRFDKIVYMNLPNSDARKKIFEVYLKKVPTEKGIDLSALAKKTNRFSGADIKNIVDSSLTLAAGKAKEKRKIVPITQQSLLSIIGKVKPSTSLAELEKHEEFRTDFERRVGKEEEKKEEKKLGWKDVADLKDVKKAFRESIEIPLLHEELMEKFNVRPTKGILLFGPPGCGKTLVVRAAAAELGVTFISISGAELMKKGYAHMTNVIKETFNRARENPPAILFVDEIETVVPARGAGFSDAVGQFLTEMDGMRKLKGVVVVGATNRPQALDPAILRPGRFDKIIYVHSPDATGREELFRIHLGEFSKGLELSKLAQETDGFSGADIASIAQKAKMELLRKKIAGEEAKLSTEDVLNILMKRRPSLTPKLLTIYERFLMDYGERK
ncbi:AAA family ATPase [Candidatus Micrarchaeota archaeon]|nr:AAA family ATPase [Candidatus Micrarchaeota archaeon]